MNKKPLSLSLLFILSLLMFLNIPFLGQNKVKKINTYNQNEKAITPVYHFTKELYPRDFFGDYSHPEFWTDGINVQNHPGPLGWSYEPEYIGGIGIQSFTFYTSMFNQFVINGYVGENDFYRKAKIDNII